MKDTAHVFIPARNEERAIAGVVRGCQAAGFAVTVIDDGSTDATAIRAREAGAEVLQPSSLQRGKTAALRTALSSAPPTLEWIIFMDGDGQHDPCDLNRFWEARLDVDLVVGNRLPDGARMPWLRFCTNRLMSTVLRGSGIFDSQCGYRLLRRTWLANWRPAGHSFEFESELALLAAARPTRVANLPIAATYAGECSKIVPLRDAINFAACLWRSRPGNRQEPESSELSPAGEFTR